MEEDIEVMAISKFKATCLAVLERVRRTGRPVLITRRGQPIAEVVPLRPSARESGWLGSLATHATIQGDVVEPVVSPIEWEALEK
jgi:prevent-host-death family protein